MADRNYTTSEVAEKIGVSHQTLRDWIDNAKIPAPKLIKVGKSSIRVWAKNDIENARKFKGTLKRGPKPKDRK
jgi:excisionase family DNA binding protein